MKSEKTYNQCIKVQNVVPNSSYKTQSLPSLVNNQCVVYIFKCDLCDVDHIGYSTRHHHQSIEEHKFSAVGKHLKEDDGAKTSSSELTKEMPRKIGLFNSRNVVHS